MTTPSPTPPAFDGSRGAMGDLAFTTFDQWWSALPTGAQIGLVLGFIAAVAAMIWYAIRHERRHTPPGTAPRRPRRSGPGRSSGPGS